MPEFRNSLLTPFNIFPVFPLRVRLRDRNLPGEPGVNQVPWLISPQSGAAFEECEQTMLWKARIPKRAGVWGETRL